MFDSVTQVFVRLLLMYRIAILLVVATFLSCSSDDRSRDEDARISVVTTTTMITDMVKQIAGDKVRLTGLMGPGVDPHL